MVQVYEDGVEPQLNVECCGCGEGSRGRKGSPLTLQREKSRLFEQWKQIRQGRLHVGVQQEAVCWAKKINEQQSSSRFENALDFSQSLLLDPIRQMMEDKTADYNIEGLIRERQLLHWFDPKIELQVPALSLLTGASNHLRSSVNACN